MREKGVSFISDEVVYWYLLDTQNERGGAQVLVNLGSSLSILLIRFYNNKIKKQNLELNKVLKSKAYFNSFLIMQTAKTVKR